MKLNLKNGTFETIILFLASPFLSIPFIVFQLKRKDNAVLILIALLFGLLSFNYIPHFSDDKVRYYERYKTFVSLDWAGFIQHLETTNRPDFIFESLLYIFAKLEFNIQYLFLIITSFTVYSILFFIKKAIQKKDKSLYNYTIWTVLLIVFSLSLGDLFSGVRFYFASAIFIWGIYFLFFHKNIVKSVLLLLLSIVTHFSLIFFIPVIIISYFFPKNKSPKIILLISLVFLFLPKDFLSNLLGMVQLSDSYRAKSDGYLTDDRMFSENLVILNFIRNTWLYFSYGYIILRKGDYSKMYVLIVFFTALVNVTYPVPLIFNRYTILLKILFIPFYLFLWYKKQMSLKTFTLISILFFLNFLVDIYVYRYNFLESYNFIDMLTIINFLSNKIHSNDFLY